MAEIIDIDAEEGPLRAGLKDRRRARARRARTGHTEKPTSRLLWIVIGGVVTALAIRAVNKYIPRQPQGALPPAPPPDPFEGMM